MSTKHESRDPGVAGRKEGGLATVRKHSSKAGSVLATSLTKRGTITQSQADSAVRRYLSGSKKK